MAPHRRILHHRKKKAIVLIFSFGFPDLNWKQSLVLVLPDLVYHYSEYGNEMAVTCDYIFVAEEKEIKKK